MLLICCVEGLVMSREMEEAVVCVSICVRLWQAVCERVMRLLGWRLVGKSLEGNTICVLRCCWLTIWQRSFFSGMLGSRLCLPCTFCWWFCEGATSWAVGVSSDRHSIAVVWGGLGDG